MKTETLRVCMTDLIHTPHLVNSEDDRINHCDEEHCWVGTLSAPVWKQSSLRSINDEIPRSLSIGEEGPVDKCVSSLLAS